MAKDSKKLTVLIICGGKSVEHEVSIQSAKNVIESINEDKYKIEIVGIDKLGRWFSLNKLDFVESVKQNKVVSKNSHQVTFVPNSRELLVIEKDKFIAKKIDIAFPVLHGPGGEDGSIQGLLKLASIPYVGAEVLGSAIGMDKDVSKRLLKEAGLPIADYLVVDNYNTCPSFERINKKFKLPFFVKPNSLGSSVGVSKVKKEADFLPAIKDAFVYDSKIIIEECIIGKEIECAILGFKQPKASVAGEIIPDGEFYSYSSKYDSLSTTELIIPSRLSNRQLKEVQTTALKTFKVLNCEIMARVDFFLTPNGKFVINEINTIPGFTNISMYPKLWQNSGLSYSKLIDCLITDSLYRFKMQSKIKQIYK